MLNGYQVDCWISFPLSHLQNGIFSNVWAVLTFYRNIGDSSDAKKNIFLKFCQSELDSGPRQQNTLLQKFQARHDLPKIVCVMNGNPSSRPPTTLLPTGRPKPTRPNDRWTKRQVDQTTTRPNSNLTKRQLDQMTTRPNNNKTKIQIDQSQLDQTLQNGAVTFYPPSRILPPLSSLT
jgi:hypothetical protein